MSPVASGDHDTPPLRLLFICTANRCRSPMAEVLARQALERRGIAAQVISAGRMSSGCEASPGAVDAMSRQGLDLRHHHSTQLDQGTLAAADLILVMERQHLADVFEIEPSAIGRAFTLGEFPDLLKASADTPSLATDDPASRIALAHQRRAPARILAVDPSSDIADPMGRRRSAYRRTARHIDHLIDATFELLYPEQPGARNG